MIISQSAYDFIISADVIYKPNAIIKQRQFRYDAFAHFGVL